LWDPHFFEEEENPRRDIPKTTQYGFPVRNIVD
jgi:hypothetical protein